MASLQRAVKEHEPDLVITDIRMPPTHTDEGIGAAISFREQHPDIGVLVLSQYSEPDYVLALFEQGSEGLGYLLKDRLGDIGEFVEDDLRETDKWFTGLGLDYDEIH